MFRQKKRNQYYKEIFNKKEESKIFKSTIVLAFLFLIFLININLGGSLDIGAKEEEKFFNGTIDEFSTLQLKAKKVFIHLPPKKF